MLVSGYIDRPDYRVDLLPRTNRVVARLGNQVIADSDRAVVVDEQGHGLVWYFHPQDVRLDLLAAVAGKTSICPFKGEATYFAAADDAAVTPIGWTYAKPLVQVAALKGYIAFYQDRVAITVAA
ncbi:MAG: nucleotidyltransferase domain-containing protein [Sphingomonas sp.]|nr:nucleotidyltransferase domain-containing protein [Sphingomonas sp.]